jgi:hypothetical protein
MAIPDSQVTAIRSEGREAWTAVTVMHALCDQQRTL